MKSLTIICILALFTLGCEQHKGHVVESEAKAVGASHSGQVVEAEGKATGRSKEAK